MQFTRMLDVLDAYLADRGHTVARIDGSMSYQTRMEHIETFNENADCFAFLLSTRAGGLGLNLTSADTVIIYDSDWNPHQDMQVCLIHSAVAITASYWSCLEGFVVACVHCIENGFMCSGLVDGFAQDAFFCQWCVAILDCF